MQFSNPWGLLALLAIPAIVALHFFRSRQQTMRIGGLHLWHDAPTRLPVGRRWERLLRSLSLVFQLLAALLVALLIAGLDWPVQSAQRHYVLILDDSASMAARLTPGGSTTPATRARDLVEGWAPRQARFTLIAAGAEARVLAGPFATRGELIDALIAWQPLAPACNLEAALALGSKFAGAANAEDGAQVAGAVGRKMLLLTDSATPADGREALLEVAALGRPLANHAIIFADRIRLSASRDKVLVTAFNYSEGEVKTPVRGSIVQGTREQQGLTESELTLPSKQPVQYSFEIAEVNETVRVALGDDALALDNAVTLAPVPVKFVRVARRGLEGAAEMITQAVEAVPDTVWAGIPSEAGLVITDEPEASVTSATRVVCVFADRPTTAPARTATGNELRAEAGSTALAGVDFGGVLWPYFPGGLAGQSGIELWAGNEPLLRRRENLEGVQRFDFNLRLAVSNLARQPAWPLMIRNVIELTRAALPGMARANFNAGEPVALNFPAAQGACELQRDGKTYATYEEPPRVLPNLPVGGYTLLNGKTVLAEFEVNLAAPGESDLEMVQPRDAKLRALEGGDLRAATLNPIVYYSLLLAAIAAVAGAWVCQDRSR